MLVYVKFKEDYFAHQKGDLVQVAAGYAEMLEYKGIAHPHPAPPEKPEKPEKPIAEKAAKG